MTETEHKVIKIYLSENFFPILNCFKFLINVDSRIDKNKVKNKNEVRSVVMRNLMEAYVAKYNEKLPTELKASYNRYLREKANETNKSHN